MLQNLYDSLVTFHPNHTDRPTKHLWNGIGNVVTFRYQNVSGGRGVHCLGEQLKCQHPPKFNSAPTVRAGGFRYRLPRVRLGAKHAAGGAGDERFLRREAVPAIWVAVGRDTAVAAARDRKHGGGGRAQKVDVFPGRAPRRKIPTIRPPRRRHGGGTVFDQRPSHAGRTVVVGRKGDTVKHACAVVVGWRNGIYGRARRVAARGYERCTAGVVPPPCRWESHPGVASASPRR